MPPLSNLATRDVETLVHPYINLASFRESGPLVIERGQGVFVYDTDGKPYIEGMAGLWCTALGYGNEELVEAAATQMRKLSFAHLFTGKSHDPAIELAEKLKEMAPVPISKIFFCNSGSEANDTQVKLVWYFNNARGRPQKKKIISRVKAYHGVTVVAASLTGLPGNHRDFDLPLPGFLHAGCPHHYRFAQEEESEEDFATRLAVELDALIVNEGPDTVAAFIAEPVMGAGGVIVPPKGYFRLSPGKEVRLRYGYFITAQSVVKNDQGEVVEVHVIYDPATRGGDAPDKRKVKSTIHWVSAAHAINAEVRLYDNLFSKENPNDVAEGQDFTANLNPNSLETVTGAKLEPSLKSAEPGARFQFERLGYFCVDTDSKPGAHVFNRTVALKDTWARKQSK